MADISTFPTLYTVGHQLGTVLNMTAGEAITAGQVVGFAATGVSETVVVMDATSGEQALGVAMYDAASGAPIAVLSLGCIAEVVNADASTAIDAGDLLEQNDNAVGGTVSAATQTASGVTATNHAVVGIALEDIAGGASGKALILPYIFTQPNAC